MGEPPSLQLEFGAPEGSRWIKEHVEPGAAPPGTADDIVTDDSR